VIQQAISCDVCGAQKRQANHWFIAYKHAGELRVSSWNSLHLMCPGTKHLCGETCVHKLIGEFLANSARMLTQQAADRYGAQPSTGAAMDIDGEAGSSGRLLNSPAPTFPESQQNSPQASERLLQWQACARRRTS